jgi:hypothetical protein
MEHGTGFTVCYQLQAPSQLDHFDQTGKLNMLLQKLPAKDITKLSV